MTTPVQPKPTPANPPAAWDWGRSLAAAAWPTLCALAFAAYALFPQRFPEETGQSLYLLLVAEIPSSFIGLAHAAALTETTLASRLRMFFICVATLALLSVLYMGLNVDWPTLVPLALWVLIPYLITLWPDNADPKLVSRQAEAVLEDKLHLLSLTPVFVIFGVLLSIATLAVLAGVSIAFGVDLIGKLSNFFEHANPSLLALVGTAYLLITAASAAHVHRPQFLRHRKALLDQPWINKLSLTKDDGTRRRP